MDKLKFIIADDDETILITLEKYISKAFQNVEIFKASDGLEAWNLVQQEKPDLVISDYRMPKIDGIQLVDRIRSNDTLTDTYFIIITAEITDSNRVEALDLGADDYITKPLDLNEIKSRIKSALRLIKLQKELKEENKLLVELADELEQDIQDMTRLAVKFLQARIPTSYDMLKRVAKASVWIAKQFNDFNNEDISDIEIAAYLSQAGKVFLPDDQLNIPVTINGQPANKMMYQVPIMAKEIVSSVRRFKDVAKLLYHLYENFDGSGFPDRLQSWQIPFGSRIIRVALDYEVLKESAHKKPAEALAIIDSDMKRLYDHRAVVLLQQYVRSIAKERGELNERAMKLHELKSGMILAQDIITVAGHKLLPMGSTLNDHKIEKIQSINTTDPILGNIYIEI